MSQQSDNLRECNTEEKPWHVKKNVQRDNKPTTIAHIANLEVQKVHRDQEKKSPILLSKKIKILILIALKFTSNLVLLCHFYFIMYYSYKVL